MAAGVRSIAIRFIGDTKGLDKAGRDGEQALGKWQSAFRRLDKVATGVLLGLGGAIAGAVTQMARTGDEIATTSQRVGVGVEALQEMRFWGDEAGISQSDLERAVGRLNQRLGDGEAEGNRYVTALQNMGVATQDANGQVRDTESVMRDTIAALRDIEDPSQRAAAAGEIFGTRLGRQLMPALSDTSLSLDEAAEKARDMGAIMDEDAVDAAAEFSAAMGDLKTVGAGLITSFATPFLEILTNDVLPVIQDKVVPALKDFGGWVRENQGLVLTIAGVLATAAGVIKAISIAMKIATAVQWAYNIAVAANPITLIILAIIALIAIIVLVAMHWDTVREAFAAAWDWIWGQLKKFGKWISDVFWEKGLKKYFQLWGNIIGWVRDQVRSGFDRVKSIASGVLDWFRQMPGRLRSGLSNLWSIITSPFRNAFNFIADAWNRTVGNLSWTVPSWVPGLGGSSISAPRLPKFHSGGVVPGTSRDEVAALLRGGEVVLTPEQAAAVGGDTQVTVIIDGRAIDESLMRVNTRRDRRMRSRALAGAGALK